jgi:hypothetical protein
MVFEPGAGHNLWQPVEDPVGFTAAILPGKTRLLEPLLLCESPKKVQSVLKDYLKQTPFRNYEKITVQILQCPSLIAVACLAKQNNVFADLATQDLLRQRLAGLKRMFSVPHAVDFSAAPFSIPGIHLLNVSASTKARLRLMVMSLIKTYVEKAAAPPGACPL